MDGADRLKTSSTHWASSSMIKKTWSYMSQQQQQQPPPPPQQQQQYGEALPAALAVASLPPIGATGGQFRGALPPPTRPTHDYKRSPNDRHPVDVARVDSLIVARMNAKISRDFDRADSLRMELRQLGVEVHDRDKQWFVDRPDLALQSLPGGHGGGGGPPMPGGGPTMPERRRVRPPRRPPPAGNAPPPGGGMHACLPR